MDEKDLIRRAREGDGAAWEDLVRERQEAVFRLAYLLLGDPAEADDIAQETFLRAYHALERFDLERPLQPWLARICANLARNRLRSLGRHLNALGRWFRRQEETPSPGIEERVFRRAEAQELWLAIRRLSFTDQQVVYLRFFLEMNVEQTAAALGVAEGTVKSRLHRALIRLRKIIEDDFPALTRGVEE